MIGSVRLALRHTHRGSWFAEGTDARTRALLADWGGTIPIIRDVGNGEWTWSGSAPPKFRKEGDVEWFERHVPRAWMERFEEGAVVWIRRGTTGPGAKAEGSKGVWRLGPVEVDASRHLLAFAMAARIGDVMR